MARRPVLPGLLLGLLLLTTVPQMAAHVACAPEACLPVVPLPDLPYVTGPVTFRAFAANVSIVDALARTSLRIELPSLLG